MKLLAAIEPSAGIAPRVAALGVHTTTLGTRSHRLAEAIGGRCDLRAFSSGSWLRALREGASAVSRDRCEMVHLFDPGLAAVGLLLRARYGVPLSATLDGTRSRRVWRWFGGFDQLFVDDMRRARALVVALGRPAITFAPPIAEVPASGSRAEAAYRRLTRRNGAGRLTVGVVWPADQEHMRWFRDAVAPLMFGEPHVVVLGAPNQRDPRMLLGRAMARTKVRAVPLTSDEIAASARFIDVVVVPGTMRRAESQSETLLALAASGAPLIAAGSVRDEVLEHERNALLAEPGDAMGLASTLNGLLTLPPLQRQYLGQDFAAYTLSRWTPEAPAEIYVDRFAALVGRPRIPVELLRAA